MKQTAVEWLADNIMPMIPFQTLEYRNNFIKFIEQAKAMEKEQITDAFNFGVYDGGGIIKKYKMSGEQYYNNTFKSE